MISAMEGSGKKLMRAVSGSEPDEPHAKITIVGVGQVGMAAAFSIMTLGVASEMALVDVVKDKLKGEMMDLQHGLAFVRRTHIKADTDYAVSSHSKICVVTAGARQREGESRLNLVQRNVDIFKHIIPQLVKYSPDTILLIVSNPVDILTYVAWKISGLPKHRVIGSGTMLDSSRFRFLLSERLNISPQSCHGYIIGEHGDSSVALWSGVNVAGTRLLDMCPKAGQEDDPDKWEQIHQDVISSAYTIIQLKGYTSWAIGTMVSTLCNAILKNQRQVYALSTMATGFHDIKDEVYLSLPCVIGEHGITHILNQNITEIESEKVRQGAKDLRKVIDGITF
jgi:L-lactate dehydrogenase